MATVQQQMQVLLGKTGIPAKEIRCFGNQIIITCWSEDAARRFAGVLAKLGKVRGPIRSLDDNKENTNTVLVPSAHEVWRVGAAIGA